MAMIGDVEEPAELVILQTIHVELYVAFLSLLHFVDEKTTVCVLEEFLAADIISCPKLV